MYPGEIRQPQEEYKDGRNCQQTKTGFKETAENMYSKSYSNCFFFFSLAGIGYGGWNDSAKLNSIQ